MSKSLAPYFMCFLFMLSSCSVLESINNNPAVADLVIKIAVSQYIDAEEDPEARVERARAVNDKVGHILEVLEGNPTLSLDGLEQQFRESVDWSMLDVSDKILADVLITNVRAQLEAKVEVGELNPDYKIAAKTLLKLIIKTAGYYGV